MSRSRNTEPVAGQAAGPDKKGRFFLSLPGSGKPLYFYGGAPAEEALVRRGRRGRRGEQGDLLEVLAPSPLRREPPCRHFGVCGGCTMQHLPEAHALELKTRAHYELLWERFPEAEYLPPSPSPSPFAYRTKVELTFLRDRNGETTLGFHRRGKFDRGVEIARCWLTPLPAELLDGLRVWARRHSLVGWSPRDSSGDLRYLVYRHSSSSGRDLAALVVNSGTHLSRVAQTELQETLQRARVDGAILVRQSSVAGAVVPDEVAPLYGPQTLEERLGELRFELGWNSFFQVNPKAYALLLEAMKRWRRTPTGGRLLDLYCGVGSIGLSLHRPGDRLLGVELVSQAVEDAKANAARNGIEAAFEHRSAESSLNFDTDLLILDPPRSGCHPKLLERLGRDAPAREIFYVSCNPYRLAEELEHLRNRYTLRRAQAFDFFPQTHHAEMLLQLEKL